jgi:hypothetical protein
MTTAIVLQHIEELTALQAAIKARIVPAIARNLGLLDAVKHLSTDEIVSVYVLPLFDELSGRFDLVMSPCITALSQKVCQKLNDNL